MSQVQPGPRFDEYLTVGEAAEMLGVSPWTLRNWDKAGKLRTLRHPQSGYRIYRHQDLEALLQPKGLDGIRNTRLSPHVDYTDIGDGEHVVQFYESDPFLVGSVSNFIAAGLAAGDWAIVVATRVHRNAIHRKLRAQGCNVELARGRGQYVALDAAETLAKFMVDGVPDAQLFHEVIGKLVAEVARDHRLRAFGEMVALLWAQDNREAAIRLEELWNDLGKAHSFALLCAYPMHGFGSDSLEGSFSSVCTCHSRVMPAESYANLSTEDERLRAISLLQQKAQALAAERANREKVAKAALPQPQAVERAEQEGIGIWGRSECDVADFFDNAALGLHSSGPDGVILRVNQAELDMLGYTRGEYVGRHMAEFHADRAASEEMLRRLTAGETLRDFEARMRCKDGSIRHVLIDANVLWEEGKFIHSRCFTRDNTERKEAEEALREADRRKDEALTVLTHDMRNALGPVRNALQIMRLAGEDRRAVDQARLTMERQVQQLVRLVDELISPALSRNG